MNFLAVLFLMFISACFGFYFCAFGVAGIILTHSEAEILIKIRELKKKAEED